jgi:predicted membrane protein
MEWLAQNWFFVVVGIILIFIIFAPQKQKKRKQKKAIVESISSGQYSNERELMDRIVNAIGDVIEKVTGNTYTKMQRIKIATGMIALMHHQNVTPKKFFEPETFVALMMVSIRVLEKENLL